MAETGLVDWGTVLSNGAGAAIGATAAFIFALWLSRMENERQESARRKTEINSNLMTINATVDACAQNLESLLSLKAQLLADLSQDIRKMDAAMNSEDASLWVSTAAVLKSYSSELPHIDFLEYPNTDKYAWVIDRAPYITGFVHQTRSSLMQINRNIGERNSLIRRWSEVGRGNVSVQDMMYFFPMLTAQSNAILTYLEDALFFVHLLHDQCYYIGVEYFQRPTFRRVTLPADKVSMLPDFNHLRGFRERVTTFGVAPVDLFDDSQGDKTRLAD